MRVTLDLHKLVILLLCVVFASCDSPFQTGTSSQLLTTSELEDRARDRGINPDFVDFQQMRKSGEHDIFISHPITLSGDQIRSLQKNGLVKHVQYQQEYPQTEPLRRHHITQVRYFHQIRMIAGP